MDADVGMKDEDLFVLAADDDNDDDDEHDDEELEVALRPGPLAPRSNGLAAAFRPT